MKKSLTTDYTDGTDRRGFSNKEVVTEVSLFGERPAEASGPYQKDCIGKSKTFWRSA